ncbi:MAG: hypothetical protein AAB525_03670 [Patescibacteria group bacterium]|mgnify:FL=1
MIKFKKFNKNKLLFIGVFTIAGLIALQIPFTQLAGSKVNFTLFDFFGPIAGGFIGAIPGVIAVFLMQFINFLIHGANIVDAGTIIRFFPALFAVFYFSRKSKFNFVIPALAIILFNLHPIGRSAWVYSLFWLIPIFCFFVREKFLLARSLGATFTAHSVGGVLWLYVFKLPSSVWISLIPITAMERLLFGLGIAAMYVIFNNLLYFLTEKKIIRLPFLIDKGYILTRDKLLVYTQNKRNESHKQ